MKWLFLRGLAREQRHWGDFPEAFRSAIPDAEVHFLDLPGAGTEHRRASPVSIEAILDDVRGRWLKLSPDRAQKWNLLGISLGGMVAMSWAESFPGELERVVVINSSAGDLSSPFKRFNPSALPKLFPRLLIGAGRERELAILEVTSRMREDLPAIAERWSTFAQERPFRRSALISQLLAASRYSAPNRLAQRLLVVSSERDGLVDPECSERLAARLAAEVVKHPEAGHDLPLDDPEWLSRTIRGWCRI